MEPVKFHYRANVPLDVPTSTNGTRRPLLQMNLPYHTVHYTGLQPRQIWFSNNGVFNTIEDVFKFLERLEEVARRSGKPYEYNTLIPVMADGSSHVIAYADEYRAAHSAGENSIAHGTLIIAGVGQDVPDGTILAFQWWNAVLEASGRLQANSLVTPHHDMPDAATACPGVKIDGVMPRLRAPYVAPAPEPTKPTTPPTTGDTDMEPFIAKPGPEIAHKTDVHFFVAPNGIVRHAQGPDTEGGIAVREIHGVAHFNGYARVSNFMTGSEIALIS